MDINEIIYSIDTIWVLFAASLVFLMQAGFAMVETGFTRSKNAGNIIMKNLMDFSVGSIMYWLVGFGIMFGVSQGGFIGALDFMVMGEYDFGIPTFAFLIFQTVFCATAATIVSGAMAERTKFKSYLVYSFFITTIIYPIVGHWTWGGGWLDGLGFHDFAGSTVVHSVGAWCAFVGASILGPRIGKYTKEGKSNAIPGHSLTLGALGVFILWFGWFGFNPGSQLEAAGIGNAEAIGHIFVTTNLSAAAAAIVTMIITWVKYKKPDVSMTLNGALGGLVAITAGTDVVTPVGAAIIGIIAGFVIVFGIELVDKVLKVDDPVGAVGVHGLCGATGTILVGLFAVGDGLFYGGGASLLGVQAIGVLAVAAWVFISSFIVFKLVDKTMGLRVSKEEELKGLDIEEHGIDSYADFEVKTYQIH
ncbi:ammonium transporter [Natranaerovirga hydrolytica]|uniref:Ammonium transporter n=1 Tax=Natranaerovirga hydrolytica TaxID=680378 RepID=A0A4V2Q1Z6_9FIRM|nr:ammonium transporter [Natranaerovirga hydrolytica]TCL00033.1 ammonium transporter [Natranaerovirga hydrolytica]